MNRYAEAVLGAALALLGVGVALGWWWQIQPLVQLFTGLVPMVLVTSVCFVLSGAWLMITALRPGSPRAAPGILAGFLLFLSAASTSQYVTGVSLGIDAPGIHGWLAFDSAYPGRLSAFTGIAFILASLAMLLALARPRRYGNALAAWFAAGTGFIGVAALIGYLLELHLLYPAFPLGLIAPHTALGLTLLCIGLWLHLIRAHRIRFWEALNPQERITFMTAAILSFTCLATAVGVFSVFESRVQTALEENLAASLRHRVTQARTALDTVLQKSRVLAGRPAPIRLLRQIQDRPDDANSVAELSQDAAALVDDGHASLRYFDGGGREIAGAGRPLADPPLRAELSISAQEHLLWKDRFMVSGRYLLADAGGPVGSLLLEAPVPALDAVFNSASGLADTEETEMCARVGTRLGCFPQARNPRVYFTSPAAAGGALLPMSHALDGRTGVMSARDYGGEPSIAAFAPLGAHKLGMTVHMDTAAVYAPIREQLQRVLPLLAVLVAIGALLVRAGVRPLALQLARSEREAREQHRTLNAMMANVADGMMIVDADGTIRSWNPAAEKLFGYSADEVVGRNISMLVPEKLREAQRAATRRFLETGESNIVGVPNLNYPALRKDGSVFELEFTLTEIRGQDELQLVAIFRDITERKRAEERLTGLALNDPLTGLPNRSSFNQRLDHALARSRRSGAQSALLFLDLDNFKTINDTLGHDAGDRVLAAFARRLRETVRESDSVARLGGDEFTVLLEGLNDGQDARVVAEKILASMQAPFELDGQAWSVSTSVGIALWRDGDTAQTLMKRADTALYQAKNNGRARYCSDDAVNVDTYLPEQNRRAE